MKPELIVALDVDNEKSARSLIDELIPEVKFFKVGSILFILCGRQIIDYIYEKGGYVFLDLKFHDIPNTVRYATGAAAALPGVYMMTAHTLGGRAMLEAAIAGAKQKSQTLKIRKPAIVGITVLTSENFDNVEQEVLRRAQIAKDAGLDGVVCSAQEATLVRQKFGSDFLIVTPGIRSSNAKVDDQKRVTSATDSVKAGVDFIVVGRPIIEASNKKEAAKKFLKELQTANQP